MKPAVAFCLVWLPSCAMSTDIRELGWNVDKRFTVIESEVADLQKDSASKADVERRFDLAREQFDHNVDAIGKKVEDRVEGIAGGVSKAVGLPEAIGIAIASMIMTWLGRDWTRKKTIADLTRK